MMKKILHISKYYYPFSGGTEQIARDCVNALKDEYEQKVIAFNDGKEDVNDYVDGIEVIRCGCFAKISAQSLSISYKKRLHNVIKTFNPDIVIFHYPNPFVAHFILKELKNNDIKFILYWHLDIVRQKLLRVFFKSQNRKLLKRADKVIATSPNYIEGSEWLQLVKEKCVVVPNCINEERMKINRKIQKRAEEVRCENNGKTICVAVGRHTEYKGFAYLIKASKLLDDNFKIYITGKGELTSELKREAADDSKVVFTGRIDDDELKAYLVACDIFCFPSITKNEAFGVALAEAMYYGKPSVTFNIPGSGVNYVCLDGDTGIEVENRNYIQYAKTLIRLSEDKELKEKYGKKAKQRVEEEFLFATFKKNINYLIEELK